MKTVVYKMNSNKIVRITEENISFKDIEEDEDYCPLRFFEETEEGEQRLEEYYNK